MVAAGDPVESSDVTTVEDYTIRKPIVRLIQQVAQSMTSGTAAALTFGTGSEDIDTHGFHDVSVNNTRITPTIAGYYRLSGCFSMSSATYTQSLAGFRKNGSNVSPLTTLRPDAASASANSTPATAVTLTANGSTDYFEFIGQQNSGGAQNTSVAAGLASVFECEFIRPL